jgi:hypothetical protein
MATGTVTAYDLLNTSSNLLSNWTRQSDQTVDWIATLPEFGMRRPLAGGLDIGSGKFTGLYSAIIEFPFLTENMQQYIHTTLMEDSPIAIVTVYAYDDYARAASVFTGELVAPYAANSEQSYSPFGSSLFTNNQYLFRAGTKITVSNLLLESGDYLLLENGNKISLEGQA